VSGPAFWESRYAAGEDGWELGRPAPPLAAWLAAGGRFEADGNAPARVAVPGCGRGHDARLLARHGYRVEAFDFAAPALAAARDLARADNVEVLFEERDVFALAADRAGAFDAVWEYTCFCAIDPARRAEYVEVIRAILRPGGVLLGCFFPLGSGAEPAFSGPPFAVGPGEVERVLAPGFTILEAAAPAESVAARSGREQLVRARRR
jgi:SAM-dependent methyltransferase